MDLLQAPPPGFDAATRAFAMARHLPASQRLALKVGLAHEGKLVAVGTLDGYRQVKFLAEHLRARGWHEHLLGGGDDMHGCDMLFSLPAQPQAGVSDDPSFIRRPAVQLWPAREAAAGRVDEAEGAL